MSDREPIENETPQPSAAPPRRRKLLRNGLILLGILLLAGLGLCWWGSSSAFEDMVRRELIARLETATGGRVELTAFHWHLFSLDAETAGLVLHGKEAQGEAPYASIGHLHARISILGFLSPRILLRDLEVTRPTFHLIVYADGSTNQPTPPAPRKPGKSALDTLFDLKAGHVAFSQGLFDYEDRAADFDSQHRQIPLDFEARDVSTILQYVAAAGANPEHYRIDAGARDLLLVRGQPEKPVAPPVSGYFQATIDLMRNAAFLRSLRITARSKPDPEHSLDISGSLVDFTHPHWTATAKGDLDMRLLEPTTGYANSPEGLARLDLTAEGRDGLFRIDGPIHVDNGSYVSPSIHATKVNLDARVHADPEQLVIGSILARLHPGGQIEGTVALSHWLAPLPGASVLTQAAPAPSQKHWRFGHHKQQPVPAPAPVQRGPVTVPIDGKVTAQFRNVPLDAVMDIVARGPFQHLGLDALLNGPADAAWTKGDARTLQVSANFNLSPSGRAVSGEAPTGGIIDATYVQSTGSVDLRALRLNMPSSYVDAHGHIGAYPLHSASAISIDVASQNLAEFDSVLRDLGLRRAGHDGAAALPASLGGRAEFHGMWTGSLIDPHLGGTLTASNVTLQLPSSSANASAPARTLHLDTIDATGSYSAARISIDHGQLTHGAAHIALDGSLSAAESSLHGAHPGFDSNSALRMHVNASRVRAEELLPLLGASYPVSGDLNAQFQTDGPIHALEGSGWVEIDRGVVYDEPIARIRANGKVSGSLIQLTSVAVNDKAGKITASGNYDIHSGRFQLNAQGSGIDLSRLQHLKQFGTVTGSLGFSISGSGTADDPRLQAQGSLAGLTVGGEAVGNVQMQAHTADRLATYDLSTHFESAKLTAHGQTALNADYTTRANLEFAQFNIAGLLRMAKVPGLTGESQLAGTLNVEGPLAHPDKMRGDLRLQNLAITLAGVQLHGDGPLHAVLANSRIALDPLHIVGDQTDLRAQLGLDLNGRRQLDLAASGSINLKLAETLDPDLTASGTTTFQIEAHGPLANPGMRGRVEFQNASLALEDLPNSLSHLQGTLEFNQNRLEVRSLTATTGGGQLSVTGYLAYQHGIFADLAVTGRGVRIRYPQGVSSLADANLQLQGTQNNLLLSGGIMITRFSISQDMDITALASRTSKVQPVVSPDAPSNHVRLDVRIQSSPQLNFQNAFAKLAGDVDLRLRGTVAAPSLLGRISVTEGNALIAGTRYELQRGDITFTNPVRIEPNIDLNATARVEDYDITLGLHGSPEKMAVSYRSDPPLPEADVVALLALGRTQNQRQIYGQQQEQASANPTTDALLGGALNATVSSRVQKLFGAGSVKVDPTYLGALGNSTTRITVEEQLGKSVTLTYATDVNTTAQQLLQAEIAINRHVSLLVARDESGVFSMVIKATRRYR